MAVATPYLYDDGDRPVESQDEERVANSLNLVQIWAYGFLSAFGDAKFFDNLQLATLLSGEVLRGMRHFAANRAAAWRRARANALDTSAYGTYSWSVNSSNEGRLS